MKKMLNLALIVTVLLLIGCSGSTEPDDNLSEFTINFQNNSIYDSGYVILQTDSTTTYQEISGDETITFENLSSDRGTVIIVQEWYTDNGTRFISITANVNALLGEWYSDGYNYSPNELGNCNITLNFPENDYSSTVMSPSNAYDYHTWGSSGTTRYYEYFPIHRLDFDGNITFFNAVFDNDSVSGYCDWVIGENFNYNQTNEYEFDLNHELTTKNISSNRLISSARIYAYRNNMIDYNLMCYIYPDNTSFTAYFSEDFPKDKYLTWVYGDNYRFDQIGDIVPSDLNIPESSISSVYDYNYNKFRNLSVIGNSDEFRGYWSHYGDEGSIWLSVYTSSSVNEVTIPEIPSEILTNFNIDLSLLEPQYINLVDFDTANDYDDVINMYFKQQLPSKAQYNQRYRYYGDVVPNDRQIKLPEDTINHRE